MVIMGAHLPMQPTSKEIKKLIGNKNTISNLYRIKVYDSIMFERICIGFTGFMWKGKRLVDYTNLFLLTNMKEIILKYFQ